MKYVWEMNSKEVMDQFDTTVNGLSAEKAEVIRRDQGKNALSEGKKKSVIRIFIDQFADLLVVILIIAAIVSAVSGNAESTAVIGVVLLINAMLGTIQYIKAKKSLDSLKKLSSPKTKVIREGRKIEIDSVDVVPGDIVVLEAGDLIVADGRIIHNYSLQVNESSLTGESTNVEKTDKSLSKELALADRKNMIYSGSLVTYGRADVVVTSTGMNTEIGKIANLMNQTKDRKTPLQKSLDQFSSRLAMIIMIICVGVFALYMYRGTNMIDSLMFAVALAVAAIPEALGSIITIVQAIGTSKMAKENAIIKDLKAVESLGCVSVICSDKTGTLTQNKMTVEDIYIDAKVIKPEQIDISDRVHRYFLYDAILSNDSNIVDGKGIGDPTEYAFLEMLKKIPSKNEQIIWDEKVIRDVSYRLEEVPFDSDRKMMSVKCKLHGKETILVKGAVDVLLKRCDFVLYNNKVVEMNDKEREKIINQNEQFSNDGLRVLAFAYKETTEKLTPETENNLLFVALASMMDPPREEAVTAVHSAKNAGIKTVMITGDHKLTAIAIAKKIGIYKEGDIALTGLELDKMSDSDLERDIEKISVYARVSPENKIRIVEAWQKRGHITSMTGDGVNDAPALKKADIGVAMGITGTEVSKDAAAMILADDNFASIMRAVANGRNVFRNIKNSIVFLLSGNMAGIFTVLFTALLGLPAPFTPVHLLFMNLLTDSLPAIAIGMEPSDDSLLKEKPRDPKSGLLTRDFFVRIFSQGALIAIFTLASYGIGLRTDAALASTFAFTTITLARLFHGFNCRNKKSVFTIGLTSNKYTVFAFLSGIVLVGIVLYVPFMEKIFQIADISAKQNGVILIMALMPTIIIQIFKILKDIKRK